MSLSSRLWIAGLFAMILMSGMPVQAQPAAPEKPRAFLPMGDSRNARSIFCIVKKDADRDFKITIRGAIGEGGAPLTVKGPDGAVILSATLPAGKHEAFQVNVPKTGTAGECAIYIPTRDGKESLAGPLTDLPKEVYAMSYWIQDGPTRFYTQAKGAQPESIELTPHKSAGRIETKDGKLLASTDKGDALKASVGPDGAWISTPARYVDATSVLILSLSPEAWFAPSDAVLHVKP